MTSRKKNQTEGAFDDYSSWEKFKKSPEVRGGKFILRICFVIIVYFFLAGSAFQTYGWFKTKWIRLDDISKIEKLITTSIKKNDFEKTLEWIRARPLADTLTIVAKIEEHAEKLPALFFYEQAARVRDMSDPEAYAFWSIYARYRLQYDLIRCGAPELLDDISRMVQSSAAEKNIQKIFQSEDKAIKILKDVVSFDAKHPANNNPQMLCNVVNRIGTKKYELPPPVVWHSIRHRLIVAATSGIEEIEKRQTTAKPTP